MKELCHAESGTFFRTLFSQILAPHYDTTSSAALSEGPWTSAPEAVLWGEWCWNTWNVVLQTCVLRLFFIQTVYGSVANIALQASLCFSKKALPQLSCATASTAKLFWLPRITAQRIYTPSCSHSGLCYKYVLCCSQDKRIYTHALQVRCATNINPRLSEETLPPHFISTVLQRQLQDRVCKTYMPTMYCNALSISCSSLHLARQSDSKMLTELKLNHC